MNYVTGYYNGKFVDGFYDVKKDGEYLRFVNNITGFKFALKIGEILVEVNEDGVSKLNGPGYLIFLSMDDGCMDDDMEEDGLTADQLLGSV